MAVAAALRLFAALLCLSAIPAAAQPARPKVGLALGGGSARGLAHIGVLRWFEEHRVPIDVISGTSMGGLIAGAYASGMTPDEIAALMRATDWDAMFVNDSPYQYKTFRRKQDKRAYPSQLEFGLKGGLRLPTGLNAGQQVGLLLDQIALPYWDVESFDDLPTPYRCVATDLRRSESVVLSTGPLARAMRATMAIPGVFSPVRIGDQVLVDGGLLNNIPADVARGMGAGVVIAVNVSADENGAPAPDSMFSLLGKTIDTMMATGTRRALQSADLIIDPDLKGLDSMSWRRSDDLATRGYAAAEAMADKLLPHALSEADYAAFQAARRARRRTEAPVVGFLEVAGIAGPIGGDAQAEMARGFANQIGRPLDSALMREDILRITGTDRYEYITYRAIRRDDKVGLRVGVKAKSYGPPFLALGLELSNNDSSSFSVNVAGRVTAYDVLGTGSELRLDLGLGTAQIARVELFKPIRQSGYFVAPRAYFERDSLNLFSNDTFLAQYRVKQSGLGLDLGYTTNQRLEIRAGYDVSDVRGRLYIGDPLLPEVAGRQQWSHLQVTFDDQNSPVVPSRGLFVRGVLRHFDKTADIAESDTGTEPAPPANPDRFTQGEIKGSWFTRTGAADRVFVSFGGGTSFGAVPLYSKFRLGGLFQLGAFDNDQIVGTNYVVVDGGYLRRLTRLPDVVGGNVYLGAWVESGSAWTDWAARDWRNDVTVGLIVESIIGPIFAGGSVGSGGGRFYVVIGQFFK